MRRCFQCGAKTDVEQLTRVGDGEFCASCFRELLGSGAESTAESVAPRPTPRAEAPSPPRGASRRTRCLVCERDLAGVPAVVFLGGEICGACSAEMAEELESSGAGVNAEAASVHAPPAREPHAGTEPGAAFTPGAGTTTCAGCERPMPGPGSYRLLQGKPYCAACWPVFVKLPAAVLVDPPVSPEAPAMTGAAAGRCDCCGRRLDDAAVARQGFRLCAACVSSDAELALRVARARHRRELRLLGSALEGDE